MIKIIKSLFTIVAVFAIAAGSTSAYFSSKATVANNTFSTGVLDIRVNGEPTLAGAVYSPAVPGEIFHSPVYQINNYGSPYFDGSSTLSAKKLMIRTVNQNDFGSGLWNAVRIKVEVNRGWPTWMEAYNGPLYGLSDTDLLNPRWSELAPGNSESLRYEITLPDNGGDQSAFMGKILTWDFEIEGRTS